MKKKEPIAYILNNLAVIYQVYVDAGKKAKPAYDALKTILPDFEKEIEWNSFNSRIKPIVDTFEFCNRRETDKQADLTQEVKRLNSVITRLYDDLQAVNVEIDKPANEVNAMINDILQRLERVEKAVFQSEVNQVNVETDKKINQVNLNNVNVVNPKTDKPVNPEKIKVGKWNITSKRGKRGDVSYKAFRNFGDKGKYRNNKGEVLKGVKGIHIGNEFSPENAIEKITAKGYPID